jgi:hypothetical protein
VKVRAGQLGVSIVSVLRILPATINAIFPFPVWGRSKQKSEQGGQYRKVFHRLWVETCAHKKKRKHKGRVSEYVYFLFTLDIVTATKDSSSLASVNLQQSSPSEWRSHLRDCESQLGSEGITNPGSCQDKGPGTDWHFMEGLPVNIGVRRQSR